MLRTVFSSSFSRGALLALLALATLPGAAAQQPIFGVDPTVESGWTKLLRNPEVSSTFRVRAAKTSYRAGEELILEVDFRIQQAPVEWYLEGVHSENVPLRFESSTDSIELLGLAEGPQGKVVPDPLLDGKKVEKHFGEVTFRQKARVRGDAAGGKLDFEIKVRGQSCKEGSCDMIRGVGHALAFEITADAAAAAAEPARRAAASQAQAAESTSATDGAAAPVETGFFSFLVFCFLGGLAMLLLPCIWPMIPITVSYFTKQSENRRGGATSLALIYGFGIVATYALIGLVTTVWLGPKAAQDFATHPILNLAIGVLFVVFALSFFGMFELQVPAFLQERLNKVTGGGGGGRGAGKGRIVGTVLLGAMFTVTSFACSAPVMASIWAIGFSTGIAWMVPLGMAVAAVAVSLPFVILALFPALMKAMPRSGGWMNTVKAFLGFVELAAALKFFSNADLKWDWQVLTWPVFMAMWAAIAFGTTLYLFGLIKLYHDDPSGQVGAPRMTFGLVTGTFGLYLLMGMFTAEPMPDFVTSFVPPKYYGRPHAVEGELEWIESWDEVQRVAAAEGKPIFLDFTGVNCTNCRLVEESVFPHVEKELGNFVLGRLFTDAGAKQDEYDAMKVALGSYGLPYYVILAPDGKTKLASSEYERSVPVYRRFLERGLEAARSGKGAAPQAEKSPVSQAPQANETAPREVPPPTHGESAASGELVWYDDLAQAREVAQRTGKRVFLDFTGNYCIPCKAMEKKVFPEAAVQEQFQRYVLVKLITDDVKVPGSQAKQDYLRSINGGSEQVPVYAVEDASGKLIEKLGGKQDLQVFVDFLKRSAG
ncbi:MAG: thioredoxin family protein [Planctomycetes bacterium]|nr:thioredoxin family protein [Planctomycetota bacterium]